MNIYNNLSLFDEDGNVHAIIEVARGTKTKYEYNKELDLVMLDRILHTPIPFPYSYGFFPQTWNADDKDPLDAIVIASEPIMPGAAVACRVVGYMEVVDRGEKDDKVLCVPVSDPAMKHVKTYEDIDEKSREDFMYFMNHYKDLENKKVEFKAWHGVDEARALIEMCQKAYQEKKAI